MFVQRKIFNFFTDEIDVVMKENKKPMSSDNVSDTIESVIKGNKTVENGSDVQKQNEINTVPPGK